VRYAVQSGRDCATLSEQAVFALGSRLAPSRRTPRTASDGLVWSHMRTALALSLGIFLIVASGVVIALRRRRSPLDGLDAVSGQWIAEHRSKLDQ
jgi:hypothetical protein